MPSARRACCAPMLRWTEQLWRLECRLNRRLSKPDGAEVPERLMHAAGSDVLAETLARSERSPKLCVVVTTYARADACAALLEALHRSLRDAGLHEDCFVVVLEDYSEHDYSLVVAALSRWFSDRFALYRAPQRLAKPGRWVVYQAAFDILRVLAPEHTLFLEDDAELGATFVRDALTRWREIADPKKSVLYLCAFDDDEVNGRWIRFRRREHPNGRVRLTQWFDLHAFLVDRTFFACLRYQMLPPPRARWARDPKLSSGVSEQFTRRLFARRNIYQVRDTLALHGGIPSLLNEHARGERPLRNYAVASAETGVKEP